MDLCDYCNNEHFPQDKTKSIDQTVTHKTSTQLIDTFNDIAKDQNIINEGSACSDKCIGENNNCTTEQRNDHIVIAKQKSTKVVLSKLLCFVHNKMDVLPQDILNKTIRLLLKP